MKERIVFRWALLTIFLIALMTTFAFAAEESHTIYTEEFFPNLYIDSSAKGVTLFDAATDPYAQMKADIHEGLKNAYAKYLTTNIEDDLEFSIINTSGKTLDFDQLSAIYFNAVYNHPEDLWFAKTGFGLRYYNYDPNASFSFTPSIIEGDPLEYSEAFSHAVTECFGDQIETLSPLEKIVLAHDWIAANCQYDPYVANGNQAVAYNGITYDAHDAVYSPYGVFVNRNAVCQGYSLAFKALLDYAGVPCCYVSSNAMGHGWNMVQLDGAWYHIDVTWDDSLYGTDPQIAAGYGLTDPINRGDYAGHVGRDYLLLNDSTIEDANHNHRDWTTEFGYVCELSYGVPELVANSVTSTHLWNGGIYLLSNGLYRFEPGNEFANGLPLCTVGASYASALDYDSGILYLNSYSTPYMIKLGQTQMQADVVSTEKSWMYYCGINLISNGTKKLLRASYRYNTLEELVLDNPHEVASGTCGDNVTWALDDEGTLTISGTGPMNFGRDEDGEPNDSPWNDDDVKRVIIQFGVTSVCYSAFSHCSNLISASLSESVTTIWGYAFEYCTKLEQVTISGEVTYIAPWAFAYCTSLSSITLPDSITQMGSYAFTNCTSLSQVNIPAGLTTIPDAAFVNCGFTNIEIPNTITAIGRGAFSGSSLTSITIPDSVTSIGNGALQDCKSLSRVKLPAGLTVIPEYMFYGNTSLNTFTVPDGITSIKQYAFNGCSNLRSVHLPYSLRGVSQSAFNNCSSLSDVYYDGIQYEWDRISIMGYNTPLKNATPHFTSVNSDNKCGDNLTWELSKSGLLYISGTGAMYTYQTGTDTDNRPWKNYKRQITSVVIDPGADAISVSGSAFADFWNIQTVTFLGDVQVGDFAFGYCTGLTSIGFGSGDVKLLGRTFMNCTALETLVIPSNVTLTYMEFHHCDKLKTATVYTKNLAPFTFECCLSLEQVTLIGTETVGQGVFLGTPKLEQVTFPATVKTVSIDTSIMFGPQGNNYSGIKRVTFLGKDTQINGMLFSGQDFIGLTIIGPKCSTARKFVNEYPYYTFEALSTGDTSEHSPAAAVRENEVPATCTVAGSYEAVVSCSFCGTELSRESKTIDALNHDLIYHDAKAATCTEIGWDAYDTCSRCDYTTYVEKPALDHDWGEWSLTTTPTESAAGEEMRTCKHDKTHTETRAVYVVIQCNGSIVTGKIFCEENQTATAYSAYYDANGRMISVDTKPLAAGKLNELTFTAPTGTTTVKWFVLDENGVPVCESVTG